MTDLEYPWAEHPEPGTTLEVAPGVRWLTMPMGGSLNHINLYLLEDRDGWWVVDTGLPLPDVSALPKLEHFRKPDHLERNKGGCCVVS